jgi:hypothetical protein
MGGDYISVVQHADCTLTTRKSSKPKMFILSLSSTLLRKWRPKLTKRPKIRPSRCERSFSSSTETLGNGKNEVPGTFDYSSTRRTRRQDWSCGGIRHSKSARTIMVWNCPPHQALLAFDADTPTVTPDMKLSPNVGSDRSWVWNVSADVSEGEPEAQTLAIRFANSESKSTPQVPE